MRRARIKDDWVIFLNPADVWLSLSETHIVTLYKKGNEDKGPAQDVSVVNLGSMGEEIS